MTQLVKRIHLQWRRPGFDPWVGKIPWRRERPPTPVFLPGESQGQKSLVGYGLESRKESDTTADLAQAYTGALWCGFTCSLCLPLQEPGSQHLESFRSIMIFIYLPSTFPTFVDASQAYLSDFCFLWLNSHFRGIWRAEEAKAYGQSQYLTSIFKLNMRTQRSIEKF